MDVSVLMMLSLLLFLVVLVAGAPWNIGAVIFLFFVSATRYFPVSQENYEEFAKYISCSDSAIPWAPTAVDLYVSLAIGLLINGIDASSLFAFYGKSSGIENSTSKRH